jgi:hypothetical protein
LLKKVKVIGTDAWGLDRAFSAMAKEYKEKMVKLFGSTFCRDRERILSNRETCKPR